MMIKKLIFCLIFGEISNFILGRPHTGNSVETDDDEVYIDLSHLGTSIYGLPDEEVGELFSLN